jgi:hypothetical protein
MMALPLGATRPSIESSTVVCLLGGRVGLELLAGSLALCLCSLAQHNCLSQGPGPPPRPDRHSATPQRYASATPRHSTRRVATAPPAARGRAISISGSLYTYDSRSHLVLISVDL